jgi:hypothetical protein
MSRLAIFGMMFLLTIGFVSALNTQVLGTVYDASHNPVIGADVSVNCNDVLKTTTTALDGTYLVSYSKVVCGFNAPVHVVATKDDQTGENDGLTCASVDDCEGIPVALVDVTIPEFGVIAGAVALIGALGIFMYRRK